MARNAVQFQKGLSMAEFLRRYGARRINVTPHSWRCGGRRALCARGAPAQSTAIVSRSVSFSERRAACRRRSEPGPSSTIRARRW
jgi:hypothetical protein